MTTPASVPVPPVQPTPPVVDAVVEAVAASRKDRAKTLAKKTFTRVGVPVLIGTAAAYVVSRRTTRQVSENSTLELTASTDE